MRYQVAHYFLDVLNRERYRGRQVAQIHLVLGLGRLKNLREGQGCPKCETAQAVVAFALAAWAGWELWQSYQT